MNRTHSRRQSVSAACQGQGSAIGASFGAAPAGEAATGSIKVSANGCLLALMPEAMPGPLDEHVFERRLAERDCMDLARKCLDQPGDPLVSIGLFQSHGARQH